MQYDTKLHPAIKNLPSLPTAVDSPLLCDEQDLVQFKGGDDDSDDDDDVIDISQD